MSSSGLCAWPLPIGVVGPDDTSGVPGLEAECIAAGRNDMLSCMTLPSVKAGDLGVVGLVIAEDLVLGCLFAASGRRLDLEYATSSSCCGSLFPLSSILI